MAGKDLKNRARNIKIHNPDGREGFKGQNVKLRVSNSEASGVKTLDEDSVALKRLFEEIF